LTTGQEGKGSVLTGLPPRIAGFSPIEPDWTAHEAAPAANPIPAAPADIVQRKRRRVSP